MSGTQQPHTAPGADQPNPAAGPGTAGGAADADRLEAARAAAAPGEVDAAGSAASPSNPEVPAGPARPGAHHGAGAGSEAAGEGEDPEGPSDAELLARLRAGDQSAYATIYQRHVGAARRLARRYSRQATDADDIVSASFADILQAIRRGAGPTDSFRYYLLACVRRNGGRNVGQRWTMPLDEATAAEEPALAMGDGHDLDRLLAWRAFEKLPPRYRTALWHSLVEGDSLAEVGEYLGLNANAAGALVHRAKEQLRQSFLATLLDAPGEPGSCDVPAADLAALARGTMRGRKAANLSEHVLHCPSCRARMVEIEPVEQAMKILIAPAVLGVSLPAYLSRRQVAGWWIAGSGAAIVAACVLALILTQAPPPADTLAPVFPSAAAGVGTSGGQTGPATGAPAGTGVGTQDQELDGATADAVPGVTQGASPVSMAAAISQPSTPQLYPGETGVLRLSVDAGDAGEVRVRLPQGLALRAGALSDTCRAEGDTVTCGPLSGQASVAIPFTLDAGTPMGAQVSGGQAWVERDGLKVAGPIALGVGVHSDPCCETP